MRTGNARPRPPKSGSPVRNASARDEVACVIDRSRAGHARDFGCGELLSIASSGCASVHAFVRNAFDERLSCEHAYPSHALVFTNVGTWSYHGTDPRVSIDESSVVAGTSLGEYACLHPHGEAGECLIVAMRDDAFEDDVPLFDAPVIKITPEIALHRRAIVSALREPERLEALAFWLFDAVCATGRGALRISSRDLRIEYAKRIMRERWSQRVTVSGIARELHLSRFTFTRRFFACVGQTPYAYLTRLRIAKAQSELARASLSVEEIAYANGFGSIAHFSHAFRRVVGTSPTNYRNQVTG